MHDQNFLTGVQSEKWKATWRLREENYGQPSVHLPNINPESSLQASLR